MTPRRHLWWHDHKQDVTRCLTCEVTKTRETYLQPCPGRRGDTAEPAPDPETPAGQAELELT